MIKFVRTQVLWVIGAIITGMVISALINFVIDSTHQLDTIADKDKPVLINVSILDYKKEDGKLYVNVVGEKVREDCGAPLKISGYYGSPLIPLDSVEILKNIEKKEIQEVPYVERPAIPGIQQNFGWWAIMPIPTGPFYLYVDYLCGQNVPGLEPYVKKNILGPFSLE